MDILPRNASPILNKNTKPSIQIAIVNPFFLKKLIIGFPIVPDMYATNLLNLFDDPSFSSISLSFYDCFICLKLLLGS